MTAGPINQDWRWTVDPEQVVTHSFGDTAFVFHKPSGTTHILNLVSLAMVDFLASKSPTLAEIEQGFPAFLEVPPEECPRGVTRRLFEELDDIGLVERVVS